jgi:DNA-3-methyladenine glycosylase
MRLASGPAIVCRAMAIDRALDGADLTTTDALWVAAPDPETAARLVRMGVTTGPRVGVGYAGPGWSDRPWRFGVAGHPALSRPFSSGTGRV